ncbi:MAG: hypothetical protein IMX00_04445 [Limnochordales bacterium]|nr:hypothetical protein [Limnochordales bacterium]
MVPAQALWELIEAEGIQIEWWPFESRVGMYVRIPELDKPVIVLSTGLETEEQSLWAVLAHELGHHFTTVGDVVVALDFNGQVMNTKAERLANEWAVRFLQGIRSA